MVKIRKSAKQRKRRTQHAKTNESRDELLDAALEQYGNIVMMYEMFDDKIPVMLFDIKEQRVFFKTRNWSGGLRRIEPEHDTAKMEDVSG